MNFLNLSLGELLGIAGAISAGVVALYLLDRSKRRQVVSTLRFWVASDVRTDLKHRRRIQQPWSLVLQIISLLLLLTALAGPVLGPLGGDARDHVLILDTSAWMSANPTGGQQGTLIEQARVAARAYLDTLPQNDRVMLVRADALATPATPFESSHPAVEEAIRLSQPSSAALNISQALEYAKQAQRLQADRPGEIALVTAGRIPAQDAEFSAIPSNFRLITVGAGTSARPVENVGIRRVGLRRSLTHPEAWDIFVLVRNDGARRTQVELGLQFAKSPAGSKRLSIEPASEEQVVFSYIAKTAGYLEVRLNTRDAFAQDNRALIELPAESSLKALVYTDEPQALKSLLGSSPQLDATFLPTSEYDALARADVVVLDRFHPAASPRSSAIWIQPPQAGAPIPVRQEQKAVRLKRWRTETSLGEGLRSSDVMFDSVQVFSPAPDDIVVAETEAGPLVVARAAHGQPRLAVVGFHPGKGALKYELATPLLIANLLRWMTPGAFRQWEIQAGTVGMVTVTLDKSTDPASIQVLDENQHALPFTLANGQLEFFAGSPTTVRVLMGGRELVYSLTLPDVGDVNWRPPANVHRGIPSSTASVSSAPELWPWLSLLGGLGLLADWLLYGRSHAFRIRPSGLTHVHRILRKAS